MVEILYIIENRTEVPKESKTKAKDLTNSARKYRALEKSKT